MNPSRFSWIDRAFLKEYFLKPLLFAIIIVGVLFALNKFTYFNFSLGSNNNINTFEVIGEGKVSAVPNIATTTFTIEERANTQEEAREMANTKQSEALAQLEQIGIKKEDIKTIGFYVNPNFAPEPIPLNAAAPAPDTATSFRPIDPPAQRGYVATVTTQIQAENVEMINQAIDALTSVGANVGGVTYEFDDNSKYQQEATEKAVADAKAQAESMAKAAGFKLGKIMSIRSANDGYGYPIPYGSEAALRSTAPVDQSTDLQPGQNEVTARIGITYYIND